MLRSAVPRLASTAAKRCKPSASITRRALHNVRPASSAAARILVERTIERAQAATAPDSHSQPPESGQNSAASDARVLPSVGVDERKVSVGWDGTTWSRLCVSARHPRRHPHSATATTYGSETTADVLSASTQSQSSVSSILSRCAYLANCFAPPSSYASVRYAQTSSRQRSRAQCQGSKSHVRTVHRVTLLACSSCYQGCRRQHPMYHFIHGRGCGSTLTIPSSTVHG